MTESKQDIFLQIDALLDKRGSEALSEKVADVDDFPILTEVIEVTDDSTLVAADSSAYPNQCHLDDPLKPMRPRAELGVSDDAPLAQDLIIGCFTTRQLAQLESVIRQIVQEELQKTFKP